MSGLMSRLTSWRATASTPSRQPVACRPKPRSAGSSRSRWLGCAPTLTRAEAAGARSPRTRRPPVVLVVLVALADDLCQASRYLIHQMVTPSKPVARPRKIAASMPWNSPSRLAGW